MELLKCVEIVIDWPPAASCNGAASLNLPFKKLNIQVISPTVRVINLSEKEPDHCIGISDLALPTAVVVEFGWSQSRLVGGWGTVEVIKFTKHPSTKTVKADLEVYESDQQGIPQLLQRKIIFPTPANGVATQMLAREIGPPKRCVIFSLAYRLYLDCRPESFQKDVIEIGEERYKERMHQKIDKFVSEKSKRDARMMALINRETKTEQSEKTS
ncbi:hypothetical protein V8E54_001800 [Elaphomyces granulatus]